MKINFRRLVSKNEIQAIIGRLSGSPVSVQDAEGNELYRDACESFTCRHPVKLEDSVIGWVSGEDGAAALAELLSYLAELEQVRRALGRETLEKYKEINLLYDVTEKIAGSLDPKEVARLVIDEAKRIIRADNVSVMTVNEETGTLEIMVGSGKDHHPKMRVGEGIAGSIALSGRAEVINDVPSDPRYLKGEAKISSLICAPLRIKDKVIGLINVSSEEPANYTAEDLKLLTALTLQAAVAIENAKLFFIKETFGRYVSDEVVSKLLEQPGALNLGGDKKHVTILMSDLRGFTNLSEKYPPETVVSVLNNYLGEMVDIIQKYHGTILEFIGDGIMVVFGAPLWTRDHATLAVACAVEMQLAMKRVNKWNGENGFPDIEMGIGINSGHVIVGNIGSEKRTKYGCVGSQVNLTSRIESYTVGGQVLISEETLKTSVSSIKENGRMEIMPKGLDSPMVVCDVAGVDEPYQLYLEDGRQALVCLPDVIPAQMFPIEGKHLVGGSFYGCLTKLSLKEAEISTGNIIPPMINLKVQVLDREGKVLCDNIYAKTSHGGECSAGLMVRFTFLSQEAREFMVNVIQQAERMNSLK